jgi:hypothetical protein
VELSHELIVRQSSASKDLNPETEEPTVFGAVTKRRLVKIKKTEKAKYIM